MNYRIIVRAEAPIQPTEVTGRVVEAIENIFPTAEIEVEDDTVIGTAHSLSHFSELLHQREILDTARSQFFESLRPNGFSFTLKKQSALMGVPTFAVGEPSELGDIEVDVRVIEPTPEELIDHIAPPTEDGVPITAPDGP